MTFEDISNIIKKFKERPDSIIADPNQNETERARELEQLRTNYPIIYRQRRDKWLEEHPGE